MTAKILDGKAIAAEVKARVLVRAAQFEATRGRKPQLDVVLVGDDAASQVYVRSKEKQSGETGLRGTVHRLAADTTQAALEALVESLSADVHVDGILVQLPLPAHLDASRVIARIDPKKDVDGLHPVSAGLLASGLPGLRPCTPAGCMVMLDHIGFDCRGKHAVVVGRSNLVGKPAALLLLARDATVTIAHSRTRDLAHVVRSADVVVAAVGKPELVRGDWIREGAVVLDVGINRTAEGKLIGDVQYAAAAERASWITPVPGGVGAMTIAMLLDNAVTAAERRA